MTADNKDSKPAPVGGIAVLLFIAAGIFVKHQYPFETLRPLEGSIKAKGYHDIQDVEARLWEDPFAAVARHQEEQKASQDSLGYALQLLNDATGTGGKGTPKQDGKRANETETVPCIPDQHNLPCLKENLESKPGTVVMGVMVYGGPYPDNVETRRRNRYAVLAGLDASGYVPEDDSQIGFFDDKLSKQGIRAVVPFEFFRKDGGAGRILLLWLPEEKLGRTPSAVLVDLLKNLGADESSVLKIIGPEISTTLRNLIAERKPECEGMKLVSKAGEIERRIDYFTYGATANLDDLLPEDLPRDSVCLHQPENAKGSANERDPERLLQALFSDKTPRMVRTINNDGAVLEALVEELKLRGALPNWHAAESDRVVLISEWDTDYGRGLPGRFIAAACKGPPGAAASTECTGTANVDPKWVVRVSYMRGLDGGAPNSSGKNAGKNQQGKGDKDTDGAKTNGPNERADGNSQYDYLRRLALTVEERAHEKARNARVKAVGVLGTDPYDKLLVLQALRPQFPEAVFFTTDLDGRLLQANQREWTRNLLIGSGLGLELNAAVQGHAPPFRSTYQTAAFLAVRLALEPSMTFTQARSNLNRWLPAPYVYEIGRTGAFAFQPHPADGASPSQSSSCTTLAECSDIRPTLPFFSVTDPYALAEAFVWITALAAFGFLLKLYGWPLRGRKWNSPRQRQLVQIGIACGALIGVIFVWQMIFGTPSLALKNILAWSLGSVALVWLLRIYAWWFRSATDDFWAWIHKNWVRERLLWLTRLVLVGVPLLGVAVVCRISSNPQGEPFAWIEGISIWPSELIRIVALACSACFILRTLRPVELEKGNLNGSFFPQETGEGHCATGKEAWISTWHEEYRKPRERVDARELWEKFRGLENSWARFSRLRRPFVLYCAFSVCAVYLLGGAPAVPYRGLFAFVVDRGVLLLAGLAFVVLLFLVVDAIRLGTTLIDNLSKGLSTYPAKTIANLRTELNFRSGSEEALCDLLDIRFIGAYTDRLNGFVYYPFIVLALMVVARSSIFDHWHTPPSLFVMFLLTFLVIVICAVMLQRAAGKARDVAVERMTGHLIRERSALRTRGSHAAQLEMMLEEIKNTRRGAFLPFLQQPIVKACLYPAGSYGGLQILEYSLTGMAF